MSMKTPMQELIEYTTDLLHTFDSEERVAMAVLDYLKTNKKEMLEKEKEAMCEFAWEYAEPFNDWSVVKEHFDAFFKTEEK